MGLSGSGKSSLLRCINGLNKVTRGRVVVHDGTTDVDVASCDAETLRRLRRNRISMVFQQFGLMPWRSVRDNVGFGLEIRGVDKAEIATEGRRTAASRAAREIRRQVPSELSGGMQQRVGLARAFATDASILLMDEPFSALDPLIREHLQDELIDLQRELKKTIVFVSHDLDEALKIGSRIAIMEAGRVVQFGVPEDIVTKPVNEYVRLFVASMNPLTVLKGGMLMRSIGELQRDGPDIVLDRAGRCRCRLDNQGRPLELTVGGAAGQFIKYATDLDLAKLPATAMVTGGERVPMRAAVAGPPGHAAPPRAAGRRRPAAGRGRRARALSRHAPADRAGEIPFGNLAAVGRRASRPPGSARHAHEASRRRCARAMPPGWPRSARSPAPSAATSFRPGCCTSSPASSATTWRWWCAMRASRRRTSWSAKGCPIVRSKPIARACTASIRSTAIGGSASAAAWSPCATSRRATLVRSGYRAFQRQAKICDELGMFLPGVGRASIALFLERSKGWFSAAEKERARRVYPAIAGLYRAHVGRIFAALGTGNGGLLAAGHARDPAGRPRRRARLRQQGMARGRGRSRGRPRDRGARGRQERTGAAGGQPHAACGAAGAGLPAGAGRPHLRHRAHRAGAGARCRRARSSHSSAPG